jgi:hypothetical protein
MSAHSLSARKTTGLSCPLELVCLLEDNRLSCLPASLSARRQQDCHVRLLVCLARRQQTVMSASLARLPEDNRPSCSPANVCQKTTGLSATRLSSLSAVVRTKRRNEKRADDQAKRNRVTVGDVKQSSKQSRN